MIPEHQVLDGHCPEYCGGLGWPWGWVEGLEDPIGFRVGETYLGVVPHGWGWTQSLLWFSGGSWFSVCH